MPPNEEHARYATHQNDITDPGYVKFLKPVTDWVLDHFANACGLDFGAGPGTSTGHLLERSGMRIDRYDPFFYPDAQPLQKTYDFIVSTEVIEHLFKPLEVFKQLHACLKPGGALVLMTARHDLQNDFANWFYMRDPTHVVFYSARTFAWIAEHLGFHGPEFVGDRTIVLRRKEN